MTFSDFQGHSPISEFTYSCAVVDKISPT